MSLSMTMILGTKRYSSWSLRPWLAARMAGLDFDEVLITLRQPDTKQQILRHSPSGKVPCLIHDGLAVWDSLAICEYLAELAPSLWPTDRTARAIARSVAAEMHSGFQSLRSICPMDVPEHTPLSPIPDDVAADVARIHAIWADCRQRFGAGGPFLFGSFTIADAMYAPVVSRFITYDLAQNQMAQDYCQAVWSLQAMQDWKNACP